MNLNIGEKSYNLLDSITHAKLGDLFQLETLSTELGTTVSFASLRTYLIEDVLKSTDSFGFLDSVAKRAHFAGVVFLCRRYAGEEATFGDIEDIALSDLKLTFEADEVSADPKELTDSAPDGNDATAH